MNKCVWVRMKVCNENMCMKECIWKCACHCEKWNVSVWECPHVVSCWLSVSTLAHAPSIRDVWDNSTLFHILSCTCFHIWCFYFSINTRKFSSSLSMCMYKWVCESSRCKIVKLICKLVSSSISIVDLASTWKIKYERFMGEI